MVRQGRSPSYLIIDSLTAASGADTSKFSNTLESDVVTNVKTDTPTGAIYVPTVFEDPGQVRLHIGLKDPGSPESPTLPSAINNITLTQYHVSFNRTDGRNTPGVDVPYAFDGAVTATVTHELTKRSVAVTASLPTASVQRKPDTTTRSGPATQVANVDTVPPFHRSTVPPAGSTVRPSSTTRLASSKPSAEQTYEVEITRLRAVLNQRRPQLDSSTVAVVEHNLRVIDDAIRQCKQALRKDPASRFLIESLNDALDTKVQLLRTAATLPSTT
jgi:hypothetical protein